MWVFLSTDLSGHCLRKVNRYYYYIFLNYVQSDLPCTQKVVILVILINGT